MNFQDLQRLSVLAKEYSPNSRESILRNRHMNKVGKDDELDQDHIDATLVDFLNFVGSKMCCDFGMYTEDLH